MKQIILGILIILFTGGLFTVQAASWSYPLDQTLQRQQNKKFGQYIDSNFYINTGNLYPTKYTGYHAGTDLEIFSDEINKPVPVYAITDGQIKYYGQVSGYGGLLLLQIPDNLTVLYGHLKLSQNLVKAGDTVKAGQTIAYLGDAFSSETGGERKHLHLAIYKGNDNYFKGYELNLTDLESRWINPLDCVNQNLVNNNIASPQPNPTITTNLKTIPNVIKNKETNFLKYFIDLINKFIHQIIPK